jgi:hypothetical protein
LVVVLRTTFLVVGTIVIILGISALALYGTFLTPFTNYVKVTYPWTLLALAPGLVLAVLGAWMISQAILRTVVPKDLKGMIGPNEKAQLYVKQTYLYPRIFGADSWLMTNERVIKRHPHSLKLRNHYEDHSYAEIKSVVLDKGIFRSKLSVALKLGPEDPEANINVQPSDIARKRPPTTLLRDVKRFETALAGGLDLTKLANSDARQADGIIRENIVRFQTPFFQTPFPSDKIAYDATTKPA